MSFLDLHVKNCTYCQEEINGVCLRCAECKDFDICLQCFSQGAEIGQHKNDHSYQFMYSGAFDIFLDQSSWSVNEEVKLLDGIKQFGFGNWEDISKYIATRSPDEAKNQYITRFIEGSIGRATWGNVESTSPSIISRLQPLGIVAEASQLGYMSNRDDLLMVIMLIIFARLNMGR